MAKKYYAIKKGYKVGVFFEEWENVFKYVNGFKGAEYKSFKSEKEALDYIKIKDKKEILFENKFLIYTDGSYTVNNEGIFSSGAVVLKNNKIIYEISKYYIDFIFSESRNIAGEVMAIIESLKWCRLNNIKDVSFFVDYQGLISWSSNEWKAKTDISKFFINQLSNFKDINFNFFKVEAHSNNYWNDYADALAKKGEQMGKIAYN